MLHLFVEKYQTYSHECLSDQIIYWEWAWDHTAHALTCEGKEQTQFLIRALWFLNKVKSAVVALNFWGRKSYKLEMETLDLEAPGTAKPRISNRLKALWNSLTGSRSQEFTRLGQEDNSELEDVFRGAGMLETGHYWMYGRPEFLSDAKVIAVNLIMYNKSTSLDKNSIQYGKILCSTTWLAGLDKNKLICQELV